MQNKKSIVIISSLLLLQIAVIFLMGRPFICECGNIKAWVGEVLSSEMSQQLTDWYTFSHIIHGFLFYALLRWLFPRLSFWQRLAIAIGIEVAWEIAENSTTVIEAYRKQALAQGYVGDSIINSLFDTFSMMLGFALAKRLPVAATISLAIGFEVFTAYIIRDNLALNILNFIYQFEFIRNWQANL